MRATRTRVFGSDPSARAHMPAGARCSNRLAIAFKCRRLGVGAHGSQHLLCRSSSLSASQPLRKQSQYTRPPPPHHHPPAPAAMERFPDGAHVRLRSRGQGGYLHADEDRTGVSLRWGAMSVDMVWKVHRVTHDGSTIVLLHSAAYCDRYLAASSDPAPPGHRVFLGHYDDSIQWKAVESGNSVLLRHISNRFLRAIDGQQTGVCVSIDAADDQSTWMHWMVDGSVPAYLTAPLLAPAVAMEQFRHGALVRLQSRAHRGYLHADEDGMAVSLCWRRESINTAWKVHRVLLHGSIKLCLQSAAHGRYLAVAASSDPAPHGHLGHRVVLRDCERNADSILWEAAVGSEDYFFLRHISNKLLGGYGGVSLDMDGNHQSAMMHWKVEISPAATPSEAVLEQFFPDGAYVQLRKPANGWYLHALEDGVHVDFLPHGGSLSLNMVWRVHRVLQLGTGRILLQNAAYGRYLGVSGSGDSFCSNVYYNYICQDDLHWECQLMGSDIFRLVNPASGLTIPTHLVAELIPSRSGPVGSFHPAPFVPPLPAAEDFIKRIVLYIPGDEYGNIDFTAAGAIIFQGRSVLRLRAELANSVGELVPERMAMCLWAGSLGRFIPLIGDLPANDQTMEVILFESWTRAALSLQYPVLNGE